MFWKRHRAGESNVPFSIRSLTVKFSICNPLIVKTKFLKMLSFCGYWFFGVFFLQFHQFLLSNSCFYWNIMTTLNFIYKPFTCIMVWDKTIVNKKHTPCDFIWREIGRWHFKLNSNDTWLVKVIKTLCKRS